MRKRNRFRNYLSIEAAVILLVILSFKVVADKPLASLFASFLFIGSSLGILFWEMRFPGFKKRISFWGVIGFLLVSALPIFLMRVLNWNVPFEEIAFAGVTGPEMHKMSNYVFFLLLICFFVDSYLETLKAREEERKNAV